MEEINPNQDALEFNNRIDLKDLPKGIYLTRVSTENKNKTIRLVKF